MFALLVSSQVALPTAAEIPMKPPRPPFEPFTDEEILELMEYGVM